MIEPIHFPSRPFDPTFADPRIVRFNQDLRAASSEAPARTEIPLEIERTRLVGNGKLKIAQSDKPTEISTFSIPGPAGDLTVRKLIPKQNADPIGIYLHFHGGGFCLGSSAGQDGLLSNLAHEAGVVVLSLDYRLAPENPYPAGLADGEAAAWWLVKQCAAEFGTSQIVLGGESAGAYLTLTTALRLRDRHGFESLAGLNLSQGGYDLRMTPSMQNADDTLVLDRPTFLLHMGRLFRDSSQRHDLQSNPLYADLRRLPRSHITVGTIDPLIDDNMFLYMRLLCANVDAEMNIYPGGFHGFNLVGTPLAESANHRIHCFVRDSCTNNRPR
ncbi:alpha/beta hydrolase [Paraburkholderia sediminicola]|uniref:alpha/beta hydrolase n=1 Tax=Paraburkholderia sediminicola TaxID=458836 RepID=UPI0038BB1BB1